MPRVSKAKTRETEIGDVETDIRNEVKLLLKNRKRRQQELLEAVANYYDNKLLELPADILYKPLSQQTPADLQRIKDGNVKEKSDFSTNEESSKLQSATQTKGKRKKNNLVPSETGLNKFQTPMNMRVPPHHMGTVTPKFNPYAPMSVVRVPKEGEVAMSLTGSPLRVTATINESKPNVIVPLENGRILSVLPERGLRMSQIPEMDENLLNQLQVLNENLNKLLSKPCKR